MTERTRFPTWAIISVITGRLCGESFSEVHACIERLAGGPVFTHQLPGWTRDHQGWIDAAFPDLAGYDVSGLTPDIAEAWYAERRAFLEEERDVPVFGDSPGGPLDYWPPERRGMSCSSRAGVTSGTPP